MERANNKCEICGLENKQTIYSLKIYLRTLENGRYGYRSIWFRNEKDAKRHESLGILKEARVVLTIAHLDHDETNWDIKDGRLKAMCQSCHLQYDAKEKFKRACNNDTESS